MRILAVNKFFYRKGGSEAYFFNLNRLMEKHGAEVIPFSMKGERNEPSVYEEYFVDSIDYSRAGYLDKIRYSAKIIYSLEARRKIRKLIADTKPDLAHLHLFQHQLSPSILSELKSHGIPVVHTLHDLKLLCPNYRMRNRNAVCEKCKGHRYYHCFRDRCVKNSRLGSLVNTAEMYVHWLLHSYRKVDVFIAPSRFFYDKFLEYGFPAEKLEYIPNFVDLSLYQPSFEPGGYLLYFGRLSEEKGVMTLLEAMKRVKGLNLLLVGDGPLEEAIAGYIRDNRLDNVQYVGYRSGEELRGLIRNSMFAVLPSEVYENSPLSVLEAMAMGKPVIGARIGGIPELVIQDRTGLVFEPGNPQELADCINRLAAHPARAREMGEAARAMIEAEYNEKSHYEKIAGVYDRLLTKSGGISYGRTDCGNL